jgi:phosphoribosylanthranilate isomerase
MRTRVKICGITRIEDGLAAAAAGADAIGLVFYDGSPRCVEHRQAAEIAAALPAFVSRVALFVNAAAEEVEKVLTEVPIDTIQFHGDESPRECAVYGMPYIKAVRMQPGVDLHRQREHYRQAAGLLVDSYRPGVPGGTGETFDWSLIPSDISDEIILAGGLNAQNVAAAIAAVHPWAVDVSGGVEASKGIKDARAIVQLMRGVQRGDRDND